MAAFVPRTTVSIVGEEWWINGRPTWQGRLWQRQEAAIRGAPRQGAREDVRDLNSTFYSEDLDSKSLAPEMVTAMTKNPAVPSTIDVDLTDTTSLCTMLNAFILKSPVSLTLTAY